MPPISTLQIVNTAIPAISSLLGVLVGGGLQWWLAESTAKRQMAEARRKDNATAKAAIAELQRRKVLAAYPLALHMEAFAKACAEAVSFNTDPRETESHRLPVLPSYPDTNWGALDPEWHVRLTDFASALNLRRNYIQGTLEEADDKREVREINARASAVVGLDAWSFAEALRREASIAPFEFHPEGWDYVETMQNHLD